MNDINNFVNLLNMKIYDYKHLYISMLIDVVLGTHSHLFTKFIYTMKKSLSIKASES